MKFLGSIFLALLLLLGSLPAQAASKSKQIKRAEDASGTLWIHLSPGLTDEDGDPIAERTGAECSFFNIEKVSNGYIGVAAAHCFDFPKEVLDHLEWTATYGPLSIEEQVTESFFGESDTYVFTVPANRFKVTLLEKGDPAKADDVSIFLVSTKEKHDVLSLADSSKVEAGDPVINVSNPAQNAIDKGLYEGIVSNPSVSDPKDPNIDKHIHISIAGPGPGSSGSAVIDTRLGGVIGVLVLEASDTQFIIVPSNTLKKFIEDHKHKKS